MNPWMRVIMSNLTYLSEFFFVYNIDLSLSSQILKMSVSCFFFSILWSPTCDRSLSASNVSTQLSSVVLIKSILELHPLCTLLAWNPEAHKAVHQEVDSHQLVEVALFQQKAPHWVIESQQYSRYLKKK